MKRLFVGTALALVAHSAIAAPATGAQGTYTSASGAVFPAAVVQQYGLENGSGATCLIGSDTTCQLPIPGGGAGGGPATLAAGSVASGAYLAGSLAAGAVVDIGPPGATVCATDTGSCALNAQMQRLLQRTTTVISTLGSPFQAGGSIGNTAFGISGTLPAYAAIPAFKIDQTTPGTTNAVAAISGAFIDCAITTIGCEADSPWTSGNGTIAALLKALATNATPVPTTATAQTAKVICASACSLKSFEVMADSTLSGAAWEILILNATSDPGNGAVTPIKCYQFAAGQVSGFTKEFPTPINFSTGATIVVSTGTTCYTEAQSSHATFIEGDY